MAEAPLDAAQLEQSKVIGAICTDLILSAEIMAIALADVSTSPILTQALVLVLVGITIGGGLRRRRPHRENGRHRMHLAERRGATVRAIRRGLVTASAFGTVAHIGPIARSVDDVRHMLAAIGPKPLAGPRWKIGARNRPARCGWDIGRFRPKDRSTDRSWRSSDRWSGTADLRERGADARVLDYAAALEAMLAS